MKATCRLNLSIGTFPMPTFGRLKVTVPGGSAGMGLFSMNGSAWCSDPLFGK